MPKLVDLNKALVGPWGSLDNNLEDPTIIASAAGYFTPIYPISRVSGTAAFTGITDPYVGFHGTIAVIPTAAFTWTTANNIGLAGTAVAGKVLFFTKSVGANKYYPSYTS